MARFKIKETKLTLFSNFYERRVMRYIIGDLTIRLCSGVFHRIETIKHAAANYDYNPYLVTKPGIHMIKLIYIQNIQIIFAYKSLL